MPWKTTEPSLSASGSATHWAACFSVLLLLISSQTMQSFVTPPISVTRYLTAVLLSQRVWHQIQVRSALCAYLPVQYSFHRERANMIAVANRCSWQLTYTRQRHWHISSQSSPGSLAIAHCGRRRGKGSDVRAHLILNPMARQPSAIPIQLVCCFPESPSSQPSPATCMLCC
jgi:hypothetical protein